jgi:DNA-binding response OmpR family regulator
MDNVWSDAALTQKQRALWWLLISAAGGIVTQAALWDAMYGTENRRYRHPGCLRVHIYQLRRKLRGWDLRCHRNIGYSLTRRQGGKG